MPRISGASLKPPRQALQMSTNDFELFAFTLRDVTRKIRPNVSARIELIEGQALGVPACYVRDAEIGEVGRVRIVRDPTRGLRLLGEVAGEQGDPLTSRRRDAMEPVIRLFAKALDEAAGVPHRPAPMMDTPESISQESWGDLQIKLMNCEKCGAPVSRLIFDEEGPATKARFHDIARVTYPICSEVRVPTWIVGPGNPLDILTKDDPQDVRSKVMRIWPAPEEAFESTPAQFNPTLEALQAEHCAKEARTGKKKPGKGRVSG